MLSGLRKLGGDALDQLTERLEATDPRSNPDAAVRGLGIAAGLMKGSASHRLNELASRWVQTAGTPVRVVATAVRLLGSGSPLLLESLSHDDARVRANAAETLASQAGGEGGGPGWPRLEAMAGGQADGDPSPRVRAAATVAVAGRDRAAGMRRLLAMLRDERAPHRAAGQWVVARLKPGTGTGTGTGAAEAAEAGPASGTHTARRADADAPVPPAPPVLPSLALPCGWVMGTAAGAGTRPSLEAISRAASEGATLPWGALSLLFGGLLLGVGAVSLQRLYRRRDRAPGPMLAFWLMARRIGLNWREQWLLVRIARGSGTTHAITLLLHRGLLHDRARQHLAGSGQRQRQRVMRRVGEVERRLKEAGGERLHRL